MLATENYERFLNLQDLDLQERYLRTKLSLLDYLSFQNDYFVLVLAYLL